MHVDTSPDTSRYTFAHAEIRALLAHASDDEGRPYLCALRLEADAAVTTDGHRMMFLRPEGTPPTVAHSASIPTASLRAALKAAGSKGSIAVECKTGGAVLVQALDARGTVVCETHTRCQDLERGYRFPEWRRPIPREHGTVRAIGVNPDYLAEACAMLSPLVEVRRGRDKLTHGLTLHFGAGADAPIVVRAGKATVVVMPMRMADDEIGEQWEGDVDVRAAAE